MLPGEHYNFSFSSAEKGVSRPALHGLCVSSLGRSNLCGSRSDGGSGASPSLALAAPSISLPAFCLLNSSCPSCIPFRARLLPLRVPAQHAPSRSCVSVCPAVPVQSSPLPKPQAAPKPLLAVSRPCEGLASENILPPNAPRGFGWMKVIPEGKLGFQFQLNIGLNTRGRADLPVITLPGYL